MISFRLTAAALLLALPVHAQDAAPNEPLPPTATDHLPPAGEAPVDQIPAISDVAPDGGAPDATARTLNCTFSSQCTEDKGCAESGFAGRLTVISDGAGMAEAEWDDDTGAMSFSADLRDGVILASSTDAAAESDAPSQTILTVLANGEARFTTHHTDPISAISYIGVCEVAK